MKTRLRPGRRVQLHLEPYSGIGGKPQLRRSVVAFLDILGFREATEVKRKRLTFVRALRQSLDDSLQHLRSRIDPPSWLVKAFSDNVALALPVRRGGLLDLLLVMGRVSEFQMKMATAGFFIRGGIAVGEAFGDEEILFGPALLEAYDIERRVAQFPRVVLAESASQSLEDTQQDLPRGFGFDRLETLSYLRDADGQLFVNYLQGVFESEIALGYPSEDILEQHRDVIASRLKEFVGDSRVSAKYLWAARYHNFVCDQRAEFGRYRISLPDFDLPGFSVKPKPPARSSPRALRV